ncbi:MAG: type I restriction endonuclease subunit R [Cetobacterium sp.]
MKHDKPLFKEEHISQIPAIELLMKLGYYYLSPEEVSEQREKSLGKVILKGILEEQLKKINSFNYKNEEYKFSEKSVKNALSLIDVGLENGLIKANENVYDLLMLGKNMEETVEGNKQSYQLYYIDWKNFENNIFHVVEEFEVLGETGQQRRPDIVLFINGIPFCVIECKRKDIDNPLYQAIKQMVRNQEDKEIPQLFKYSQILMVLSGNDGKYGTTRTPEKMWSKWTEEVITPEEMEEILKREIPEKEFNKLFSGRFSYSKDYFQDMEREGRLLTDQDRLIISILSKDRVRELIYQYILFSAGNKIIARYQQYFAIQETLKTIETRNPETSIRNGGLIWHTQGSGKSYTMVMLAKAIALKEDIKNPKIIVVTDRKSLDKQIMDTFHYCDMKPVRAKTGSHLCGLIKGNKTEIITTIINKFSKAVKEELLGNSDENVFILIDEGHRSQGKTLGANMRAVYSGACLLGFTGTPILKGDKNSKSVFERIIHSYPMESAVKDGAVVPLLYDSRFIDQEVKSDRINSDFEKLLKNLTEDQKTNLKRKWSALPKLVQTDGRINLVAMDIYDHFQRNLKDTPFKGMLACDRISSALKYQKVFQDLEDISVAVVISKNDIQERNQEDEKLYNEYWEEVGKSYRDENEYEDSIQNQFKNGDLELLIVVDKLLTGFDAPRASTLYIDKKLAAHNLLQAIARVNRLYPGKDYGHIIDYRGLLGELEKTMSDYREYFKEYDSEDIQGSIISINDILKKLKSTHARLWDVFKSISNNKDMEEYEAFLMNENIRDQFQKALKDYSVSIQTALEVPKTYELLTTEELNNYKDDWKYFEALKYSALQRYNDEIDYKEYEGKMRRLLNTYIDSKEPITVAENIDITDPNFIIKVQKNGKNQRSQADMIVSRLSQSITENMDSNPYLYIKFSEEIAETIEKYREQREKESEYLEKIKDIYKRYSKKEDLEEEIIPEKLKKNKFIQKLYLNILENLKNEKSLGILIQYLPDYLLKIDEIIKNNIKVDWTKSDSNIKEMRRKLMDELMDLEDKIAVEQRIKFRLSDPSFDMLVNTIMELALIDYRG